MRFGYSGEGYAYLQRVIESTIAKPLQTYIQESVLLPLGMARTSYLWQPELAPETTLGYDSQGHQIPKGKPNQANAGTTLHTSLADYSRFVGQMINDQAELDADWRAIMLTRQTQIDDNSAWGLGWGLKEIAGDWIFWQWGDNNGFKHLIAGSVNRGQVICVLTNGEKGFEVWNHILTHTLDPQGEILDLLSRL